MQYRRCVQSLSQPGRTVLVSDVQIYLDDDTSAYEGSDLIDDRKNAKRQRTARLPDPLCRERLSYLQEKHGEAIGLPQTVLISYMGQSESAMTRRYQRRLVVMKQTDVEAIWGRLFGASNELSNEEGERGGDGLAANA